MRRLVRIRDVVRGPSGALSVQGHDDLLEDGAVIQIAALAGAAGLLLRANGRRQDVTIAAVSERPGSDGRNLVVQLDGEIDPDGLVGGTVMLDDELFARAVRPTLTAPSTVTLIAASVAAERGLPRIGFRFDRAGTSMGAGPFPSPGCYVRTSGPPGGTLLFEVRVSGERGDDPASIERAVRAAFVEAWLQPVDIAGRSRVSLAGQERTVIGVTTGQGARRVSWAASVVPADAGALLVVAGVGVPGRRDETVDEVIGHPQLAPLYRTFAVNEAPPPRGPSGSGGESSAKGKLGPAIGVIEPGFGPEAAGTWPVARVALDGWVEALAGASLRRALGSLFGLAVGDALGTTHEFKRLDAPAFPALATGPLRDIVGGGPFGLDAGQVTDDTQMATAIADFFAKANLLTSGQLAARYLAWSEVAFDVGVQTRQALDLITRGAPAERAGRMVWDERDRFPSGNGSLMRTAVFGVMLAGLPEARRQATLTDSAITHFDPRCQLACAAFNAAIAHALVARPSPQSMLRAAAEELALAAAVLRERHPDVRPEVDRAEAALATDLLAARDDDPDLHGTEVHILETAGFVRVAFRLAFWHLLHASDLESALIDVANRGGDADTNAAIVGALLGAFHGIDSIPAAWLDRVLRAPGLVAGEWDFHPRLFLPALARGFGADRDHGALAELSPHVAAGYPTGGAVAAAVNPPAELAGMRVVAWLRGTMACGQARVEDADGTRYLATTVPGEPPAPSLADLPAIARPRTRRADGVTILLEPEPAGVALSIPALPLRVRAALPVLADLLALVRAAADAGAPIQHLAPETVHVAGDGHALRVVGLLLAGDAAAWSTSRAARLAWTAPGDWCAAPELVDGSGPTFTSGVFSACAVFLHLVRRRGPYRTGDPAALGPPDLPAALDRSIADAVRAGLHPDPRMRPPARVLGEIVSAARG